MSDFQIVMPKMGESVQEAVITKIFVKKGDKIEEDDVLFEIATDKVDSEIPSPVSGVISDIRYKEDDLVAVGEPLDPHDTRPVHHLGAILPRRVEEEPDQRVGVHDPARGAATGAPAGLSAGAAEEVR